MSFLLLTSKSQIDVQLSILLDIFGLVLKKKILVCKDIQKLKLKNKPTIFYLFILFSFCA